MRDSETALANIKATPKRVSLCELAWLFLKLGAIAFGGHTATILIVSIALLLRLKTNSAWIICAVAVAGWLLKH